VSLVLSVSAPAVAADDWPVVGHDAAQSRRSTVPATLRPLLLPGWPVIGTIGPARVAPGGAVSLQGIGFAHESFVGRDGLYRRIGGASSRVAAIGPDGRRYAFADPQGNSIRAWSANGVPLWVSDPVHLGPEASERGILPSPGGLVFKTGDYGVAAFDANGKTLWTDEFGWVNSGAIAVGSDGVAYYGFDHRIVARRPDGTQVWTHPLQGGVLSVALTEAAVIVSEGRSSALGGAAVVALARSAGAESWRHDTGLTAPGPPAVAADGGIFVVVGRTLVAFGPDGALRWRRVGFYAGGPIIGGDGTVYAGGQPLTALRPFDGTILWRLPARSRAYPESIGANGTLYVDMLGLKLALAPPGVRGTAIPPPPRRPLISQLRLASLVMRARGAPSLCPTGRASCRPRAPLATSISFRLSRPAAVTFNVRRVGSTRVLRSTITRAPAGTSWRALDFLPTAPGTYCLSARAAAGHARVTTLPLRFRIIVR